MTPKTTHNVAGQSDAGRVAEKTVRRDLAERLRELAKEGSLAEIYFMREVLMFWENSHMSGDAKLALAAAFSDAINGTWGIEYLRVPEEHSKAVQRYIESLTAGEIVVVAGPSATAPSFDVQLPRTIRLSEEERAFVARLVRLLREKYWLTHLVRTLLTWEAECPDRTTIEDVEKLLQEEQAVEQLVENVRRLKSTTWASHPVFRAVRDEWSEIDDYKDSVSIRRLIKSAEKK